MDCFLRPKEFNSYKLHLRACLDLNLIATKNHPFYIELQFSLISSEKRERIFPYMVLPF